MNTPPTTAQRFPDEANQLWSNEWGQWAWVVECNNCGFFGQFVCGQRMATSPEQPFNDKHKSTWT